MFTELSAHETTHVQDKYAHSRAQGFVLSRDIGCPQLVALNSQALLQAAYGAFLQCGSVLLVILLRRKRKA